MAQSESFENESRAAIRHLIAEIPTELEARIASLQQLRTIMLEEIAAALGPQLNEALSQRSVTTLQERRATAKSVDRLTRELGLATECPYSEKPALLIAEPMKPGHRGGGRFSFLTNTRGGVGRSHTCADLPPLQLVPAPVDFDHSFQRFRTAPAGDRRR